MRLLVVTIPAGCLLACLGGLLLLQARVRSMNPYSDGAGTVISNEPPHLVTDKMTAETEARKNKIVPTIEAQDVLGAKVTIGSHDGAKPQFVYFLVDGCPCCFSAEPLFHDLYKQFQGQIDFVAVTNAEPSAAKTWQSEMTPPYALVSDPKEKIISAYGAKAALYSVLITPDGHIAKMWPGYSKDLLLEMNSLMAKLAGTPERPFDPKYAPTVKATGCAFTSDIR